MHHSSSTDHAETKAETIERIDVEIKKIEDEIQILTDKLHSLRSQRNDLSSITHTIPTEVLSEIFAIVRFTSKIKKIAATHPDLSGWLSITHVSRHWRKVALDTQRLWCRIDVTSEVAIKEFLVRSGMGNLSVDIMRELPSGQPHIYSEDILADIFAQSRRFQTLLLQGSNNMVRLLPHVESAQAPNLQQLTIAGLPDARDRVYLSDEVVLFQGATPRLDTLTLIACQMNPTSSLFLNDLTSLDVCQSSIGSTLVWLNILKRLPRLWRLKLDTSFTDEVAAMIGSHIPIPGDFEVVPLLQLFHLTIVSSWLQSDVAFLEHIAFPSHTELMFTTSLSLRFPGTGVFLNSPLAAFLRVHSQSRCNTSQLEIKSFRLETSFGYGSDSEADSSMAWNLIFSVHGGESQAPLHLTIRNIDRVPRLEEHFSEIRTLPIGQSTSFTTNLDLSVEMWEVFSGWLPNLEEISISSAGNIVPMFLKTLGPTAFHQSSSSANSTPLFRSLKSVQIKGGTERLFDWYLMNMLEARQRCGLPIKKLKLCNWQRITTSLIARLKGMVEEVDCHECVIEEDV